MSISSVAKILHDGIFEALSYLLWQHHNGVPQFALHCRVMHYFTEHGQEVVLLEKINGS